MNGELIIKSVNNKFREDMSEDDNFLPLFDINFKNINFYDKKDIFSLNLDLEKKAGTLSTLEMEVDKEGVELKKRKTTTFIIQD